MAGPAASAEPDGMARLVANAVPAIRLSRQLRGRPLAVMECVGNLLGCVEVGKGLNVSSVWDAVASAAGTQCFGLRNAECDAYDAIEGSRSRRLHPRPMGQAWWEDGGNHVPRFRRSSVLRCYRQPVHAPLVGAAREQPDQTVGLKITTVRPGLVLVTRQEENGITVSQILDLGNGQACSSVTMPNGALIKLVRSVDVVER